MTLARAFADQSISCSRLGSPFMGRLFDMLAHHWPRGSRLDRYFATFDGDIGPAGASLPLRLAGGLHALVLKGSTPDLAEVYPPNEVTDDKLRDAVIHSLHADQDFLLDWVTSAPQTNEVRRSAALMAGAAVVNSHFPLPLWLSELGASGGLNMMWDHFELLLPETRLYARAPVLSLQPRWQGALPPLRLPRIAGRAGVDLNPLDPQKPDDLLRMTAFLWPDQPERLALTRAAASVMDAPIDKGDAIDWLYARLHGAPEGHVHLIQHTVAWQYFPQPAQDRGRSMIEAAGAKATADTPLAWLSLETDGDTKGAKGAALVLRLWPGDLWLPLGRADFHGRWVQWDRAN